MGGLAYRRITAKVVAAGSGAVTASGETFLDPG